MNEKKPRKAWWQPAIAVFSEVTGWIVVPIIVSLFLGRYLDEKFHKEPLFFLGLTAIAFIISCFGVGKVGAKYIRQIERENKEKSTKKDKILKDE